jgi:hypothetical protein
MYQLTNKYRAVSSLGLLSLFVFSFLFTGIIHEISHGHDHATKPDCSLENEENPCHRALVHNDVIHACDHNQHLIAESEHCEFCEALLNKEIQFLEFDHSEYPELIFSAEKYAYEASKVRKALRFISNKGPPLS